MVGPTDHAARRSTRQREQYGDGQWAALAQDFQDMLRSEKEAEESERQAAKIHNDDDDAGKSSSIGQTVTTTHRTATAARAAPVVHTSDVKHIKQRIESLKQPHYEQQNPSSPHQIFVQDSDQHSPPDRTVAAFLDQSLPSSPKQESQQPQLQTSQSQQPQSQNSQSAANNASRCEPATLSEKLSVEDVSSDKLNIKTLPSAHVAWSGAKPLPSQSLQQRASREGVRASIQSGNSETAAPSSS